MLTTIIYAHPYDKSFNHAILQTVIQKLKKTRSSLPSTGLVRRRI